MKEPTLLDVYAALAMHALIRHYPTSEPLLLAQSAMEFAKAMLAESIEAEHGQSH